MKRISVLMQAAVFSVVAPSILLAQTSSWVFLGSDGRLHYQVDSQGNRIMDFSFAGYKGGGVALPAVPGRQMVSPSGGDDTAAIQAAINAVSALAPDASGFRGAVVLSPGTFNCSGTVSIATSGVVLRGSGSGSNGTVINMTGNPHTAFSVAGTGSWQTAGSSAAMTDPYVPSGTMFFNVDNSSGFNVGDTILIRRPVTSAWISFMGMDLLVSSTGQPQTWLTAGSTITTDRVITAVAGNQITLDAPLTDSFDSAFLNPPGGSIIHYTFPGRISQVGVEHLAVIAPPLNVDISQPQFSGLSMSAVLDGWGLDLGFQDTQNTIGISGNVKQVTLDNVNVTHTVTHTGDRMADFGISGTQVFINRSSSTGNPGEWPFVTQGRVAGPNALLNFFSTQQAGISAHQRWATGLLADNSQLPNAPNGYNGGTTGISYSDRGNHGSGQGWAMGWGVAWNVTTPWLVVQMPAGAQNWCIGCVGTPISGNEPGSTRPVPDGIYDSLGTLVTPSSLYLAQMCDRLGAAAVANIGYSGACGTPDFTISATPPSQSVVQGQSTSYTATVGALSGFTGTVVLSASGLPSGATGTFSPSSIGGGSGSSTLSVTASSTTPTGTFTVTITGTSSSPSLTHSTTVALTVNPRPPPDFAISAAPSSQTVTQGGSTSYTAMVSPVNGFNGAVNLAVSGLPGGASGTFNPPSISGGSGSSALNVSTSGSTPAGSYTLTITGTSTSPPLSHSTTVTLAVNPSTALPPGWTDTDVGTPGVAGSATFTSGVFTVNGGGADIWGSSDNFHYASTSLTGDVMITARVASQQNTNLWAKSGVMIRETTAANSTFVHVFVTPGHGVNMQYRPSTGASTVQLAQVAGPAAPYWVQLVRSANTFTGFASADGVTWTQVGSIGVTMASNAREGLAVTAHNNLVLNTSTFDNVAVMGPGPDFAISASPSSQTVTQGGSSSYTVAVAPSSGFTGTVNLSVSGLPSGATGTFNPTSISGGSGSSTLTIATTSLTPPGSYTLTIMGTSGSLSHSAAAMLVVNTSCVTGSAGDGWHNTTLASAQTGTFTAEYDATPSASPLNAVVALSQGAQTAYTGFATLVRFNPSGAIDARNGGTYGALSTIPYSGGVSYHFRLVINVPGRTYSIYATPAGGSEQTVGTNFAFRTEQSAVASLDWWGLDVNVSSPGSLTACNFTAR